MVFVGVVYCHTGLPRKTTANIVSKQSQAAINYRVWEKETSDAALTSAFKMK